MANAREKRKTRRKVRGYATGGSTGYNRAGLSASVGGYSPRPRSTKPTGAGADAFETFGDRYNQDVPGQFGTQGGYVNDITTNYSNVAAAGDPLAGIGNRLSNTPVSGDVRSSLNQGGLTGQALTTMNDLLATGGLVDTAGIKQAAQMEGANQFQNLSDQIAQAMAFSGGLDSSARTGQLFRGASDVASNIGIAGLRADYGANENAQGRRLGALDPAVRSRGLAIDAAGKLGSLEQQGFANAINAMNSAGQFTADAARLQQAGELGQMQGGQALLNSMLGGYGLPQESVAPLGNIGGGYVNQLPMYGPRAPIQHADHTARNQRAWITNLGADAARAAGQFPIANNPSTAYLFGTRQLANQSTTGQPIQQFGTAFEEGGTVPGFQYGGGMAFMPRGVYLPPSVTGLAETPMYSQPGRIPTSRGQMDIPGTTDSQLIAVTPGETIIPKDTSNAIATGNMSRDEIVKQIMRLTQTKGGEPVELPTEKPQGDTELQSILDASREGLPSANAINHLFRMREILSSPLNIQGSLGSRAAAVSMIDQNLQQILPAVTEANKTAQASINELLERRRRKSLDAENVRQGKERLRIDQERLDAYRDSISARDEDPRREAMRTIMDPNAEVGSDEYNRAVAVLRDAGQNNPDSVETVNAIIRIASSDLTPEEKAAMYSQLAGVQGRVEPGLFGDTARFGFGGGDPRQAIYEAVLARFQQGLE